MNRADWVPVLNLSCLYPAYVRGQAYLAAGQVRKPPRVQKILDHSGIVWNCWTGRWRISAWRGRMLEVKTSQRDADAARVRALAAYKDFYCLEGRDPDVPILKKPRPSTRSCNSH